MNEIVLETDLGGIFPKRSGKVRDIYDLGDKLLIVTTDRISAYDCILPNGIPGKGVVLNKISEYWFRKTGGIIKNHLISTSIDDFPVKLLDFREQLEGRSMLVEKSRPIPVECIVRGYLSGSGWTEYNKTGSVCGVDLPAGLLESGELKNPIFTPSTKASDGTHDINITFEEVVDLIGETLAFKLRDTSIRIYEFARQIAVNQGIIIADTKFEFGIDINTEELKLIDEILTPDSSRFWLKSDYVPGRAQNSFDKQFVRDYLNSVNWNRKPPAPVLPENIVQKTREKYENLLEFLNIE